MTRMYMFKNDDYSKNFNLKGVASSILVNLYSESPITLEVGGKTYKLDPKSSEGEPSMDGGSVKFSLPDTKGTINVKGNGQYIVKQRSITPDGSELITISYASFDSRTNTMFSQGSHKIERATGTFANRTYYVEPSTWSVSKNYLKNLDYKMVEFRKY